MRRLRRLRAACPVEVIFYENDVPGQRAQFTVENARFSGQPGSPGGAAKTGPLPYDTDYIASYVAGRYRCRGQAYYGTWRRAPEQVTGVRYRLAVRLRAADVGQRVVIRWRRPARMAASRSPTSWAFSRSMMPTPSRSAPPAGNLS